MIAKASSLRNGVVIAFFAIFLLVGLSIFKDYGISWDENIERDNGIISLNHVAKVFHFHPDNVHFVRHQYTTNLDEWRDRHYPVAFNLPLAIVEGIFQIKDERTIYQVRHLLTFIVFFCGVYALFLLAERRFASWRWGLIAACLLILSPRFFAEAFYNSKDIVLLAMFAVTTNVMVSFLLNPTLKKVIFLAIASALAMNVRLMATVFPVMTIALLFIQCLKGKLSFSQYCNLIGTYLILTAVIVVALWPWLWSAPWHRFVEAIRFMVTYKFDATNFFQGQTFKSNQLPWYYLPVWIGITTPLLYLFLFIVGLIAIIRNLWIAKLRLWQNDEQLQDLIFFGLGICPILAVMAMHSVLYDSWRHMYFVYFALLLIILRGWVWIWRRLSAVFLLKIIYAIVLFLFLMAQAWWIIQAHPLQNLFFNRLAGSDWYQKYDVDYWGLANGLALAEIAAMDSRPIIKVWAGSDMALQNTLLMMPFELRGRFIVVDSPDQANYIVTNFRGNQTNYEKINPNTTLVYEKTIDNEPVIRAYQIRDSVALTAIQSLVLPLEAGSTIHFSKNAGGDELLIRLSQANNSGTGWSAPESWGVWTEGSSALLYLGTKRQSSSRVQFDVRPFLARGLQAQVVGVYLNGQLQKTLRITQPNETFSIDLQGVTQGVPMLLEFKLYTATRPKDLGIDEDDRLISIGLISAQVF